MAWSIYLVMFAGIPANPPLDDLGTCHENYHAAHAEARQTGKPLLIVMNRGAQSESGNISIAAIRKTRERRKLLEDYVVVIIDTTTSHGQIVHRAYEHPKLPHVAVLDKRQVYEIFATSEPMYGQRWTEILQTYRRGARVAAPRSAAFCST